MLAVQPDGGDLGDLEAGPLGLGDELDPDLEAGGRVDADLADELHIVRLERVRGVAGADPGEHPQGEARHPRQEALQERSPDLLAAA